MLPAVTSNVAFIPPQQAPLVNTAILGSEATRVPYDNVAPSVSNAQVDNNTKGNSTPFASPAAPAPSSELSASAFALPSAAGTSPVISLPTNFIAQILGQDISGNLDSVTRGILVAYERLVALSDVKYKPSNALKPSGGPAGAFSELVQQNPPVQQSAAPVAEIAAEAPSVQNDVPVETAAQTEAIVETISADVPPPAITESLPESVQAEALPEAPRAPVSVSPGVSAYQLTSSRNETITRADTTEVDTSSFA